MFRSLLAMGVLVASLSFAEASAEPRACAGRSIDPNSPIVGTTWAWRIRDDGRDWWPWGSVDFRADGSWWELNQRAGRWCMVGDILVFGYDPNTLGDSLNSTFRLQYNATSMIGTESWDAGGTGAVELSRR